jgi:S1-C subfamily serine protease
MDAIHLSEQLGKIVEGAAPNIVRVDARPRVGSTGTVWAEDVVLAADHTIENEDSIEIGLPDARTVPATLVGRDPAIDLAVLKVGQGGLPKPNWASGDGLKVGHLVLALGRPGRTVRAKLGIVSALGEAWRTWGGGRVERYLETDLTLFTGFSGGPLVDMKGELLGLNTSALRRGASLTLPVATLRRAVATLLAHGKVRRGFLGVGTYPVRLPRALAQTLGQESGLMIVGVAPQSPAEAAGLFLGDVVVSLGGKPVEEPGDLLDALDETSIGAQKVAGVVRGGTRLEVQVIVGAVS